ncbi:homocysteine S-methyltransferase family protein [Desulfovibrio sp. OttesenSCG-928-I05]|nr:homocysteine S-methyltransferase family protein [Desulfovibrio sp. OttesenSCG-928-I05]
MSSFREILRSGRPVFFDGGLGTMLQARGLPPGASPEGFSLERPEILRAIHKEYALAGADVVTTNTFGGTSFKLPKGLEVFSFNRRMAEIAREAADEAGAETGRRVFVAGSLGPSGLFMPPLGDVSFEDMVAAYREQIRGLLAGGVDLLLAETQFDLAETRAILFAVRQESDIPLGASMTFEDCSSLTGSSPEVFAAAISNMDVDFIGTNCSAGPREIAEAVERLLACSPLPLLAQPNAGLPELVDGETVFRLSPEPFAEITATFSAAGVQCLGGCCGTTPDHIRALKARVDGEKRFTPRAREAGHVILTSRSSLVRIGLSEPVRMIGERINPTGKKQLTAELSAGEFTTALRFSDEQIAMGATVLDVNVGAPMVDETVLLPDLATRLAGRHTVPLCLDSSNPAAIAAALSRYPGSPLVNSISGEAGSMETLGPLCRDFGAPFILLPLQGKKLPETAAERIAIIEKLLREMEALRIPRHLAMVDVLALTVSANPMAARECLAVIRHCAEVLKLPTSMGLSNISFGLPARELINSTFLSMSIGAGLSACIANPGNARVMEALAASDLLNGKDEGAERFIGKYSGWTSGAGGTGGSGTAASPASGQVDAAGQGKAAMSLEDAVILGRKENIEELVAAALEKGEAPFALVNERLIPAITVVGGKYESKEYFLPQLIRSAEAMQAAFALLRPHLERDAGKAERPVIVTATVEGDIHDIGKNIVNLMLENHGFEVVDLGKDVTARSIVDAAREKNAAVIGLSALMTTTMIRMQDTVSLLQEEKLAIPVMVGGAVVTQTFAEKIGAAYSPDAVGAVRTAHELVAKRTHQ